MTRYRLNVLMTLVLVPGLAAASPTTVAHQGRLLDASGSGLNATTSVTIRLYTQDTGGDAVWAETDSVIASRGYYATVLGDDTPLSSLDFGQVTYWVGVAVDGGTELAPRTQLQAVPVALARPPGPVNILGEGRCTEASDVGTLRYQEGADTVELCATAGWRPVELGPAPSDAAQAVPGFAGVEGVDMSSQGFSQCAGTSTASDNSTQIFSLCEGYSEIIFGCSANPGNSLEYVSVPVDITGTQLLDNTCDDYPIGAMNPYGSTHILSLNSTNPGCASYDVYYDMYVHMGTQWGCGGIINTHNSGGSVYAWVR